MGGGGKSGGGGQDPIVALGYQFMAQEQQRQRDMQQQQQLQQIQQDAERRNQLLVDSMQKTTAETTKTFEDTAAATKLASGLANRDKAYSGYLNAAGQAADYVNNQIKGEQANAALLGINYDMNDAVKSQRINDHFASLWSEGDQASLDSYMKEFGNPEGFTGFSVKRGTAPVAAAEAVTTKVSDSKQYKKAGGKLVDQEPTLGSSNVLGV
jgi:hypothetical protein